jgi:hypothetical protein
MEFCFYRVAVAGACSVVVCASAAAARADDAPPAAPPKVDVVALTKLDASPQLLVDPAAAKRRPGWDWKATSGATLSVSDNRSVAGQTDGTSFAFGFKFDSMLALNHGASEWRNTLAAAANVTETPVVPRLIKGGDALNLETIYLYHLVESFGLFARAKLSTTMFRGVDVRAVPITYAITRTDGAVVTIPNATFLPLSDAFKPMTLTQSLGVFVQPYRRPYFNLEVRVGPGAQEILAHDQLSVTDDATTLTTVEVTELDDSQQLGPEVDLAIWGEFRQKRLTYRFEAGSMMPLVHSALPAGDDRDAPELTNFNFLAQLSVHLVEWASLDYELRMVREPQLLDAWQVQNNLLVTFGITVAAPPPKQPTVLPSATPPPPPPM